MWCSPNKSSLCVWRGVKESVHKNIRPGLSGILNHKLCCQPHVWHRLVNWRWLVGGAHLARLNQSGIHKLIYVKWIQYKNVSLPVHDVKKYWVSYDSIFVLHSFLGIISVSKSFLRLILKRDGSMAVQTMAEMNLIWLVITLYVFHRYIKPGLILNAWTKCPDQLSGTSTRIILQVIHIRAPGF